MYAEVSPVTKRPTRLEDLVITKVYRSCKRNSRLPRILSLETECWAHAYTDQERASRGGGAQPRKSGRCPAKPANRRACPGATACTRIRTAVRQHAVSPGRPVKQALVCLASRDKRRNRGRQRPLSNQVTSTPAEIWHHRGRATQKGNQDWPCLARVLFHPHFHFVTPLAVQGVACAAEPQSGCTRMKAKCRKRDRQVAEM